MYKYILFDLDNTLLDFDDAEDKALTLLFKQYNVDDIEKYKKVYTGINKDLWHKLEINQISKKELVDTRFSLLFKEFNIDVDGKKLAIDYEKCLGLQGQHIEGAIELLESLKDKYILFAATNGITNIQKNRLKNSKIEKYFDKIYISEQMGCKKPDYEFFEHIRNDVNFNKNEVLIIGDSITADIQGGINYGIDTMLYDFNNKYSINSVKCTYIVKNYDEIKDILNN